MSEFHFTLQEGGAPVVQSARAFQTFTVLPPNGARVPWIYDLSLVIWGLV